VSRAQPVVPPDQERTELHRIAQPSNICDVMPGAELTFVTNADPKTSATVIGRTLSIEFTERASL
jgi:hypothetical protein